MPREFPQLPHQIVQAPMAGGPSTPELASAVANAGGLGFVAAGYRSAAQLRADIEATSALSDAPIGVNLFLVTATEIDERALAAYVRELEPVAARFGAPLGAALYDDDQLDAKLGVVRELQVPIVSFTFWLPITGAGSRAAGREHEAQAPSAYPYVHHLTAPLRAAARAAGDLEAINLWAGQAYALAQELPAAQLVRAWSRHAQM
jgi:NAD(P)H-dependent flavin oxidoreductase YrpB (nitropropane dioxygenase family)